MNKPEVKTTKKVEEKFKGHGTKKVSRVILKVIGANIVNLVLVAVVFYLLGIMPKQAEKIKELRSASIVAQETSDAAVIKADIDKNEDKIEQLKNLFVDDQGFGQFIREVNAIRAEGVITQFDFPGQGSVTRGKLRGYPVIIVFQGNLDTVNGAFSRIMDLPFLLSPESIEVIGSSDNLTLNFGALLLVNDSFSEN